MSLGVKAFSPALLAAAVCCAAARGQKVTLPAKAEVKPGLPTLLVATADGANVVWLTPDPDLAVFDGSVLGGDSKRALVFGAKTGTFRVWAVTAKGDRVSERAECLVTVGTPPEPPPPGPGPGPGPGPNPPPTPGDNPFPADGKARVLILFDHSLQAGSLPAGFYNQVYGGTFRKYLLDKTSNQYRIWPDDVDGSSVEKEWADALKKPRTSLPWVYLSNGKTGYSGPLPATPDETTKLLQKYGL
jgi:hypothetical protein